VDAEERSKGEPDAKLPIQDWFAARDEALSRAAQHDATQQSPKST
jgi:hypothetical protein